MKRIPLKNGGGKTAQVDDDQYERVMRHEWELWTNPEGKDYARAFINGEWIFLHDFIFFQDRYTYKLN